MRILLVEDEAAVWQLVRDGFRDEAEVLAAATCAEGRHLASSARPDLVIIDIGLPDSSGLELCRYIRSHPALSPIPIVILTARDKFAEKEAGFKAGADHYFVKPISMRELRLWVRSLMRRMGYLEEEGGVVRSGDLAVDPRTRRVTAANSIVGNLTRREFSLLYELVRRHPKVLSKEFIVSSAWKRRILDNTVETHVKNLRAKLGACGQRIVTVPGSGYRFD